MSPGGSGRNIKKKLHVGRGVIGSLKYLCSHFNRLVKCYVKTCSKMFYSSTAIRNEIAKVRKLLEERRKKEKQIYSKLFS